MSNRDYQDEKLKIFLISVAFFAFVGLAIGAAIWGLFQ